ncbi:hypothetical protein L227DRAFT_646223 [Lentinus tigrinus ALCF2SS1-6]|uniref:F-box domain-containing protein n=1 Tax=Lentinus tigrinus ALCF2SS1-6 TaxID=1328759 RepID=A0A5C2SN29_9APHY|nr:hypothetical protein L227DRAFT_646223 [Lentinus tigrinus ALCF2SS1-6]
MTLLSELFNIANRFLGGGPRKDCLNRLPNEILLDIFGLLDIFDIIRLRRVSKLYRQLSKDAALWKALLRRADIPLPILPPTSQNTIDRMSGFDAERILVRAYSITRNWQSPHPKALREWTFDTADYRVLDMTLLPGGNHLITSACNRDSQHYSLIVWDLDVRGAPKMVAGIPTDSKAYNIQAKYMTLDGVKCLVLAYLQRDYLLKRDIEAAALGRIEPAGQLSTYHKIDTRFHYECVAGCLSLENMQRYVDIPYPYDTAEYRAEMKKLPKAFIMLRWMKTRQILSSPVLGELFGDPHLVVVKGAKDIVFMKLVGEGRAHATLTCMDDPNYAQWPHAIKAIQLLPQEDSVFVMREVDTPRPMQSRRPTYLFETYAALRCGHDVINQQQLHQCWVSEDTGKLGDLTHIYLPEMPTYIHSSDLVSPTEKPKRGQYARARPAPPVRDRSAPDPPPPICIYAHRSHNPEGVVRIIFHPQRFITHLPPTPIAPTTPAGAPGGGSLLAPKQITYRHTLMSSRQVFQSVGHPDDILRIIPAATRPLVCVSDWDDRSAATYVAEIIPFIDRGWEAPARVLGDFVVRPQKGFSIGTPYFGRGEGDGEHDAGPGQLGKRVVAFAWEESIGRLVMAEEGVHALTVISKRGGCMYEHASETKAGMDMQTPV